MAAKTLATYISEMSAVSSLGAGDKVPLLEAGAMVYVDGASIGGGGGITALTGDVTASGSGSVAATIALLAVTNAKVATGIDAVKIADGSVTNTEFQYIGTLTSDAQTQISAKQTSDATLTAFAALVIAADSLTIGTGADAFSQTSFAANTFPAKASTGNLVAKTITDFGLSLVDDTDASAGRSTLGLGTLATQSGTFSGTSSGTNTGDQTNITGNAGTVTVADAGGDTTTWVLLGTAQTGSLAPATDAGLTYNATTNALTATTFIGALTGNADTVTGFSGTSSGTNTGDQKYPESTGIITGGALSIGTGGAGVATTFTIAAGTAQLVDNTVSPPTVTALSWAQKTDVAVTDILTQLVTFVAIDSGGNVIQSATDFTPAQQRQYAVIGAAVHSNQTTVNAVNQTQVVAYAPGAQANDLMYSLGVFNVSGNVISANGANLKINKSAGSLFRRGANYSTLSNNPHVVTTGALTQASLRMQNQTGAGSGSTTDIDVANYDVAGTTTAISPSTRFSVLRVFLFQSNLIAVQRGQAIYQSLAEAKAAIQTETYTTNSILAANGLLRGFIVAQANATSLSDTSKVFFIEAGKFGGSSGVGGLSVSTLQNAYDNSSDPEITTDSTRLGLTIKRGSGADSDVILEGQNNAGSTTFSVTGAGTIAGLNLSGTNTGNQTITNSSDATSHTVTLSATGGSVQLVEGSGVTLTTTGTGSAGIVTIAASGGSTVISPSQITSDQDNYNPTGFDSATIVRLSGDNGFRSITSFAAPSIVYEKVFLNIGDHPMYLPGEHPDGTAANRNNVPKDLILYPKQAIRGIYDPTGARWLYVGDFSDSEAARRGVFHDWGAGSVTAGDYGNATFATTGGTVNTGANATSGLPSYLALTTSTSGTASTSMYLSKTNPAFAYYGSCHAFAQSVFSLSAVSDGTETYTCYVSLTPTVTSGAPGNNSVGIRYTHGTNSGKFEGFSIDNAAGVTAVDLGVTVAATTLYTCRVEIDKAISEARFYVNNVFCGRVTASMPSASAVVAKSTIVKSAGTTSVEMRVNSMRAGAIYI